MEKERRKMEQYNFILINNQKSNLVSISSNISILNTHYKVSKTNF